MDLFCTRSNGKTTVITTSCRYTFKLFISQFIYQFHKRVIQKAFLLISKLRDYYWSTVNSACLWGGKKRKREQGRSEQFAPSLSKRSEVVISYTFISHSTSWTRSKWLDNGTDPFCETPGGYLLTWHVKWVWNCIHICRVEPPEKLIQQYH